MGNRKAAPLAADETTVERQDKALTIVQRLLWKRGIRARRDHMISLGLFASRPAIAQWPDRPPVRSWLVRLPPELVVIDSAGRRQATVTMGPRAESYLVSLPARPEPHSVGRRRPQRVVALISQAVSRGAA